MYEQIQNQMNTISQQFAQNMLKANELFLANAEQTFALQMKTFEERANANLAFWGAAAEVRDAEGVQAIFPKGVQLARDNAERVYQTSQEIVAANVKIGEQIAELVKGNVAAANDGFQKTAAKVAKSGK